MNPKIMATTARTKKTNSAQQWAWEFLRRNPDYRDAFQKLTALSIQQKEHLNMYQVEEENQKINIKVFRSLCIYFFDTSQMIGYANTQKTVGDYLDETQEMRAPLGESGNYLPVAKKFKVENYSLAKWCDPEVDLNGSESAAIWRHINLMSFGLKRRPTLDNFKTTDEISDETGWHGWPYRSIEVPLKKADGRMRKQTESDVLLGMYRGIDGRAFAPSGELTEFSVPETQAVAIFNLDLPIEFQLKRIKAQLQRHQEDLIKSGFVQSMPKQADRFGMYTEYLEILDLLNAGRTHLDIAKKIDGLTTINDWKLDPKANKLVKVPRVVSRSKGGTKINELTQAVRKKIERAISLRDHGYRALAFTT